MSFCSLAKGITPKICWFCLVLIYSVLLNLLCGNSSFHALISSIINLGKTCFMKVSLFSTRNLHKCFVTLRAARCLKTRKPSRNCGPYDPDFHRSSSTTEVIFSSPQLRWKVSNVNQMLGPCPYQSNTAVWLVLLGNSDLDNTGHNFSFYCLPVTAFALKYHKQNKTTWWADRKSTNMRRKWRCFYC